ncbi:MAG: DUF4276 family protein [Synergistales bacterium]|nr:DUF4276 family protein [Synergistales bacterium]
MSGAASAAGGRDLLVLCEGPADAALLERIRPFLAGQGWRLRVRAEGGVNRLLQRAPRRAARFGERREGVVAILVDAGDLEGSRQRSDLGRLRRSGIEVVPVVRTLEAWLLADSEAVTRASGLSFRGMSPTDGIEDPKAVFLHHFHRAVRERRRSFLTKERDFIKSVLLHWDINRAREHNRSLALFCRRMGEMGGKEGS